MQPILENRSTENSAAKRLRSTGHSVNNASTRVNERNGDISTIIRRARLYPTSYIAVTEELTGTCTVCRLYDQMNWFRTTDYEDLAVCLCPLSREWPSGLNSITTLKGTLKMSIGGNAVSSASAGSIHAKAELVVPRSIPTFMQPHARAR